jgi:MoxR-like ATPase
MEHSRRPDDHPPIEETDVFGMAGRSSRGRSSRGGRGRTRRTTPETGAETTNEHAIGEKLTGIKFIRKEQNGKIVFQSSGDGKRKMVEIKPGTTTIDDLTADYTVRIVQDTSPRNPKKGKLLVEVIEINGQPIEVKPTGAPEPIEIDHENDRVFVFDTIIPYNPEGGSLVPDSGLLDYFTLDERTAKTVAKIASCVEQGIPCLLEGDTATSKTSAIMYLALRANMQVERLNMNGQTDTSELIGKYVPNDGQSQIEFETLTKNKEALPPRSRAIIDLATKEDRGLTLDESKMIAAELGIPPQEWRWQDGVVTRAMRQGSWLLLDEINLAPGNVRERLNSLLEKSGKLLLSENGGEVIAPHEHFRVFATMNPVEMGAREKMSAAEKDRWIGQRFVLRPSKDEFKQMMEFLVFGKQPEVEIRGQKYKGEKRPAKFPELAKLKGIENFLAKFASFFYKLDQQVREGKIGKNQIEKLPISRRRLIAFLDAMATVRFIDRRTRNSVGVTEDPKRIILHAIDDLFLDLLRTDDDRTKVKNLLKSYGLTEETWNHFS